MTRTKPIVQCVACRRLRPHAGRYLCKTCYRRARCDGTLADYPRVRNTPTAEWLDDWIMLRDDGYTAAQAAPRLGLTYAALNRALCRAVARGDEREYNDDAERAARWVLVVLDLGWRPVDFGGGV